MGRRSPLPAKIRVQKPGQLLEMLSLLKEFFSSASFGSLAAEILQDESGRACALQIQGCDIFFFLGTDPGILVDLLDAVIQGLDAGEDSTVSKSSIRIDKLRLRISQQWANMAINSRGILSRMGLQQIRLTFRDSKALLRGAYKKGISFPFSLDIKVCAEKNRIRLDVEHFWMLEMIQLPKFLQNLLLDILRQHVRSDAIEISHHSILLDIAALSPLPLFFNLKDVFIEGEFLVLEALTS